MKKNKITLKRVVNSYKPSWKTTPGVGSEEFYKKWGFHYEDLWNLDAESAYYLAVRLTLYRDSQSGLPTTILSHYGANWETRTAEQERKASKAWRTILNKMILGFYLYASVFNPDDKQEKIINKAYKLFAEWHESLWD
jgi:hypothetical protein